MTRRVGNILIIEEEPPQQCDDCGKVAELRPYGPPGKTMICIDCMRKDEEGARRRFLERLGISR